MKIRFLGLLLLTVVVAFSLAGCGCFIQAQKGEAPPPKSPEERVVTAPAEKRVVPVPPEAPGRAPAPAPAPAPVAVAGPALQDVNFDFDKYNIRPGDAEKLKKNFDWFKANAGTKVKVEGHCDERGTVEYNLALGQKRADSTKNYLTGLGVDAKLLETISYGKERPLEPGHNEEAWAKNRRATFAPIR